jgi:pilus assembly protein CpaC
MILRRSIFAVLSFTLLLATVSRSQNLETNGTISATLLGPQSPAKDIEGAIPNTTIDAILSQREVLSPEFGFADIFLTPGSSAIMDIHQIPGYLRSDILFYTTNVGVIANSSKDASGGERVQAGSGKGTTQVLVYEKVKDNQGVDSRGKLLKVYRVTVSGEDLITLMQELKSLIGDVEGLEIRIVGAQVVVDGAILVPRDMRRVLSVTGKYIADKRPVINLAEISPRANQLIAEKMEEEIAGGKDRPRDIGVKVLNNRFFLSGSVDTDFARAEAERICLSYVPESYTLLPKDSSGQLTAPPNFPGLGNCISMVRRRPSQAEEPDPILAVRIDFVQMNRSYLKSFDFNWSPGMKSDGNISYSSDVGRFVANFAATLSNLFPKLDTAASHGYARVMKSAELLVRDGRAANGNPPEATLSETTTFYTLVPASQTSPSTYQGIPVVTSIALKARTIQGSDKVNLDVVAKQNEAKSSGGGAPPTVSGVDVKTSIVVSNGESAALGGLISERRSIDYVRDPASKKDQNGNYVQDFNLFELGRSHTFNDEKSQFIIFVTPRKLRNPTEGTENLKRKFRMRR